MKNYTIFHPLYLAFFSKSLYQDVGRNWKGIGASYLLLLLALCWLPIAWQAHASLDAFIQREAPGLVKQVPEVKVKDDSNRRIDQRL